MKLPVTKRFYVYQLEDTEGSVFYVGKGTGDRPFSHIREAERGCWCSKCIAIRDAEEVTIRFVYETDDELAAYKYEAALIDEYGVENLTNIKPEAGARIRHKYGPEKKYRRTAKTPQVAVVSRPPKWFAEVMQNDDKMPQGDL